jgi:hypothetical protein
LTAFLPAFVGFELFVSSPGKVMATRFSSTEFIVKVAFSDPLSSIPS